MQYKIDHDFHLHSSLSTCSNDPEQSPERMLAYAKKNHLSSLVLTDHFWDEKVEGASNWYKPQNYSYITKALPLPKDREVFFGFGCETDMDKNGVIGISAERFDAFDFVIIPTTHLHMTGFTLTEENAASNENRARLWAERLDALLGMPLPFHKIGIAHLACPLFAKRTREDYLWTLDCLPDEELHRLFAKAASLGVGIELNGGDMAFADSEADTVLRMFRIAKHQGCKFYLGSDAHHPKTFVHIHDIFERAVKLLGLTEADKFYLNLEKGRIL